MSEPDNPKSEASEEGPGTPEQMVSLNYGQLTGVPFHLLTSADVRSILRVGRWGPVASCGCDGPDGNCGCRGQDCPCNKVTSSRDLSISEFLRERDQIIRQLKRQLESQRVTDEQIERLRDQKS
jgi:hypothetical protein